jgi:diguanylate cyclase (GGDEF)-like protein
MPEHEFHYTFLTTLIQATGIMLMAGMLLPMTRAIPNRFLRYWAYGWVSLTVAQFALFASYQFPDWRPVFLTGYCLAEYLFGFLLWAGCREFATGRPLRAGYFLLLGPPAVFGLIAPALLRDINHLRPFHSTVMGGMFLLALLATRSYRIGRYTPTTGLWLLRAALVGLTLLFWHYSTVSGYILFWEPAVTLPYLQFSSLYDVLLETGLAFGMVMLAADRMREELEAKNRQLATATEELAHAARSDVTTGLLNRRAFDELLNDRQNPTVAGSLAVIDVNDLKPLNDQYGHPAGDAALKLVARALRAHFRLSDPIFRTGGDEFVIVMIGCNEAELAARLAKIDIGLAGQRLPGVAEPLDVAIAWGVAEFDSAAALTPAYIRADEAMYACKRSRKGSRPVIV